MHAGNFGHAQVLLGVRNYFRKRRYFWVCVIIFGNSRVLFGLCGYFCTHACTFKQMWVLWAHVGPFRHQGTFGHTHKLLGVSRYFGVWGSFWACAGTSGHTRVLLGAWVLFGMLWYFWEHMGTFLMCGYFLACVGTFGSARVL